MPRIQEHIYLLWLHMYLMLHELPFHLFLPYSYLFNYVHLLHVTNV